MSTHRTPLFFSHRHTVAGALGVSLLLLTACGGSSEPTDEPPAAALEASESATTANPGREHLVRLPVSGRRLGSSGPATLPEP